MGLGSTTVGSHLSRHGSSHRLECKKIELLGFVVRKSKAQEGKTIAKVVPKRSLGRLLTGSQAMASC